MRSTLPALALVKAEDNLLYFALAAFGTLTAKIKSSHPWSCEEPEHSPASPGQTTDSCGHCSRENLLFVRHLTVKFIQKNLSCWGASPVRLVFCTGPCTNVIFLCNLTQYSTCLCTGLCLWALSKACEMRVSSSPRTVHSSEPLNVHFRVWEMSVGELWECSCQGAGWDLEEKFSWCGLGFALPSPIHHQ